jgi:hypothetical protein
MDEPREWRQPHRADRDQAGRRSLAAMVTLSEAAQEAFEPQVAFDARGDAFAVWESYAGYGSRAIVEAAFRPARGSWQAPVKLSEVFQRVKELRLAVDARGEAIAVWRRSDGSGWSAQAASGRAGAWQAPVNLAAGDGLSLAVAVDPRGDAVAVWEALEVVNGSGDRVVKSAFRPAGGAWDTPVKLSEHSLAPQVAIDRRGEAVSIWERSNGDGTDFVQAAVGLEGSSWQTPVTISALGQTSEPEVALDGRGRAIALWVRYDGSNRIVQAAVRSARGVWATPANISEIGQDTSHPQLGVGAGGGAVAVWQRYSGSSYVVQAASYQR